jgi:hypothetical protein
MEILAPPPTDPMVRSEPPFEWGRAVTQVPQRDPRAVAVPVPDLDPDIALWRAIIVNIWPFTGAPTTGEWPKGWFGIDSGGTPYVCTVGGEPGTWVQLATGSGGAGWPTDNGAGPGNLVAETAVDDTVGYNLTDEGSGGISLTETGSGPIALSSGVDSGGTTISDAGAAGVIVSSTGAGGLDFDSAGGGDIVISYTGGGNLFMNTLPTADPHALNALWNNLGILTVSAG